MYKVHSTSPYESRGSCICLSPWTPLFSPRCQNPIGSPSVFASSGPKGQIDPYFLTGGLQSLDSSLSLPPSTPGRDHPRLCNHFISSAREMRGDPAALPESGNPSPNGCRL